MNATRRRLACLPVALVPGAAQAFRLEPAPAEVAAAYGAGCRQEAFHAALQAELAPLLPEPAAAPELTRRLAALARCPFCGCAVAMAPMEGGSPDAPAR